MTLPVEYDASHRALAWLKNNRMLSPEEPAGAKDALNWAACTYVAAAIGSLATLLYFIFLFLKIDQEIIKKMPTASRYICNHWLLFVLKKLVDSINAIYYSLDILSRFRESECHTLLIL
mgnify:CR=1 FL=1